MGAWKRIRGKILSAKVMAWAGAINTVLSAVLYLGDFITTVLALRDYYHYQFLCPHLPPSSDVLRHDPVCRAVNVDPSLHNMGLLFWWCVGVLALGHLSYAIVFYCFCRRRIIRIALFMPLLQLYRLIRVLMRTCSTESLNELQRRQRRLQSLHTYLVVALESVPQFILQSLIVLDISQYIRGSNDPDLQPQQIPKTLVISIIFSFSSAIYNAAISMYLSMDSDHTSLSNRLCMSFMIGLETAVSTLEHGVCIGALWQHDTGSLFTFPLGVLLFNELMVSFLFFCVVIRRHYQRGQENSICATFVQAIVLTLVIRFTGPTYVLTLMQKTKVYLICGTFITALGKLSCPIFVFLWDKGFRSPCIHSLNAEGTGHSMNRYLNCTVIKATLAMSFVVSILMVIAINWIYKEEANSNRPWNLRDILGEEHGSLPLECRIPSRSHNGTSGLQIMQPNSNRSQILRDILCGKHGSFPLECRTAMRSRTTTSCTQLMKVAKEPSLFNHFIFLLIFFVIKRFKQT